ncbi:MAG: prepilin-type N-terminal cleavage/methylation domain-containing protein [Peptococcaceae bacterium]|nr:prepilin-type N-terminal cleavage/methylation domain-containing protein [Peptococcaceae bacterium]
MVKQVSKNEKGFTLAELLMVIEPSSPPAMFQ